MVWLAPPPTVVVPSPVDPSAPDLAPPSERDVDVVAYAGNPEKKRLDFALYAILIDVGGSTLETLAELADRISRVSELTDEGVKDLFTRV